MIHFNYTEDIKLAAAIEEKNLQSMKDVYDIYSPALYGMIYQLINNKQLSEDCLTATFLKAWDEIATFHCSGTSLFTWLLQRARQSALEILTQKKEENPGLTYYVNGHDRHYSAFELVYSKGLSKIEAAEAMVINGAELCIQLRADLQNMKHKKKEYDQ